MKLKVNYDEYGAYVEYKNKRYYINLLQKHYIDFDIEEIIKEPIDTYVLIKEIKPTVVTKKEKPTYEELVKLCNKKDEEIEKLREENLLLRASEPMSNLIEDYGYKAIIDKAYKKLIKSKEYIAVKSLGLNSKMSILIELEEILALAKTNDKEK